MINSNVQKIQLSKNKDDVIKLTRIVGSGAFGSVFHGKWKGIDIAVKRTGSSLGKRTVYFEVAVLKELQGMIMLSGWLFSNWWIYL